MLASESLGQTKITKQQASVELLLGAVRGSVLAGLVRCLRLLGSSKPRVQRRKASGTQKPEG